MQAQSYLTLLTLLRIVHFILFAVATPIATVPVYSISHKAGFFQSLQLSFDCHAKNSLS